MKANQQYVRVALRPCVDVEKLKKEIVICGVAGESILQQVIAGNGVADIPLNRIRLATESQSEVEIIFDNFELMEPRTLTPLFSALIRDHCRE